MIRTLALPALMASALTLTACATAGGGAMAGANGPRYNDVAFAAASLPDPAVRRGQTISVNGADIFVEESGTGPAMVLLHGYPLSGALFTRVRDRLDDTHRVITLDHRGYGRSRAPDITRDIATYARDAHTVLDQLGVDSAVVGGMSMGGPIALEMLAQDDSLFDGLILIDTNHKPAGPIEQGIWQGTRRALESSRNVSAITPFLMPNMLTGQTRLVVAPGQVDYLTSVMDQASLNAAISGTHALETRRDYTDVLRGLDLPILVVVGREDTLYPVAVSRQMADLVPGAELAVIPGAAHAAVFERPDAVADAILDFHRTRRPAR